MKTGKKSYAYSEENLASMASRGDLNAFNELVLTYQDRAYHHAYALLGDPASAEDVTQESFIRAFQSIAGFRGGSFRAWILKIVTNSAYDLLRQAKRHPTQSLFPEDEDGEEIESPGWVADPTASVENIVEQTEFSSHLYRLLGELPAVYRTVLTLIDINELDYAEAARILKVPVGTVKSRLARARLRMLKKLESNLNYGLARERTTPSLLHTQMRTEER